MSFTRFRDQLLLSAIALLSRGLSGNTQTRQNQDGARDKPGGFAVHEVIEQKLQQINELNASLEQKVRERTAALAASEQESRTLIENTPDTVARYDRECRRIYVNRAFAGLAEGGAAALLGKRPSEVPGGKNAEIYEGHIRQVFASGSNAQFELKWPGKDSKEVCSHIRLTPEFDLTGNVVTVLGVGRDITELNQSRTELAQVAEALRQKDELLEESQLIARMGSYAVDIPGNYWESSKGMDDILGVDASYDRTAGSIFALVHPDDRAKVSAHFKDQVVGEGKPFDLEYRIIRHRDGALRWMHGLGRLERDAGGRPLKIHGTIQDITERKEVEQQLNSLLSFNRTIVEKSPAGIAVYRADGPCIMANEAYARTIGTTAREILKQNFRTSESWRRNGLLDLANRAFATGSTIQRDIQGTTTYNKRVSLNCLFAPIEISGESHLLLITSDVSERMAAERALTDSMRQLEQKELAKTRFLAAAGHDLRQPLAAANLYIDALKFAGVNSEQQHIIGRLEQAMTTFNGLLDALLNISKLDAGITRPAPAMIQVSELMNWLEQNFSGLAASKKLGFKLYFSMREPQAIYSDIGLVKSVLMNLVSNAIKFTPRGAILVSARRRGGEVMFQVWDTGIGIKEEHRALIFDEFYQIDNPQRDRTSGLGLGLSIASRALQLLGGKITLRSQPGRGSVFSFSLPAYRGPAGAARQADNKDTGSDDVTAGYISGRRFVLVEDDKLVAQAMTDLLEGMGGEVRNFHRAEDALNHPQISQADCYIVDHMLGGALNGSEFLNQLNQKLGHPICAVLVTGDTSTETLRRTEGLAWPVLHKPVNAALLISTLRKQKK